MTDTLAPVAETKAVKKAAAPAKFRVRINSDENDKSDVFLSHNCVPILIQRDQEVVISEYYLNALKDSTIDTFTKGDDGVMRPIRIPRYSYSVEPA